jgi:hypothetical protein
MKLHNKKKNPYSFKSFVVTISSKYTVVVIVILDNLEVFVFVLQFAFQIIFYLKKYQNDAF